ncbi:hypothetical protein PMAYCL1PPCAC_22723, partial [Pristionchus mayeri]
WGCYGRTTASHCKEQRLIKVAFNQGSKAIPLTLCLRSSRGAYWIDRGVCRLPSREHAPPSHPCGRRVSCRRVVAECRTQSSTPRRQPLTHSRHCADQGVT